MNKQTAVEWLFENINIELIKWSQGNINAQAYAINVTHIKEQAKQMEKEQIFNYIKSLYVNGEASLKFHETNFEQYYNETYNPKQ